MTVIPQQSETWRPRSSMSLFEPLNRLLAPRAEAPKHVFFLRGKEYTVAGVDLPELADFWWRLEGRVLRATLLPEPYDMCGLVTYFNFQAERDAVFETVRLEEHGWTILGAFPEAEEALAFHRQTFKQLTTTPVDLPSPPA